MDFGFLIWYTKFYTKPDAFRIWGSPGKRGNFSFQHSDYNSFLFRKGQRMEAEKKETTVNKKRLVSAFCRLVSIDAPSFGEREMADALTEELESLGFFVEEDRAGEIYGGTAGNLYAFRKGELLGSPLLFSTHMDTVEPALGKQALLQADGRITSDGTTVLGADCMAGTAALLEALRELLEEGKPIRDLELLFFIGEEKHLRGSAVFDFSKVKALESYILDLSGPVGTGAFQAPTLAEFTIEVYGKAAHAGFAPEEGIHAVAIAARGIARMELGHVGEEITVNVGAIEGGGRTTNIVPEYCRLMGEVRGFSHERVLEQAKKIEELFREEAGKAGGTVKMICEIPIHAYTTPKDHESVKRFRRACEKLGLPGILKKTFGGSDQNNLSLHGIHGLVLASAMEQVHSCREYTEVSALIRLTELIKALLEEGRQTESL